MKRTNLTCDHINKWSKGKLVSMTDEMPWVVLTRSRPMRPVVAILDSSVSLSVFIEARCSSALFLGHVVYPCLSSSSDDQQACGSERKTSFVIVVHLWSNRCPRSFLDPCWCVGGSSITILPHLVQIIRTSATLVNLCLVRAGKHVTVSRYC